jgi:hypothetical protein
MNTTTEFALLTDIAKLLRKHGPEAFEELARRLSSPEFAGQLVTILSEGARVARQSTAGGGKSRLGKRTSPSDLRMALVELAKTDPERSRLLLLLFDNLSAKIFLPKMQDLRAFALHAGLPPLKANARPKALVEVVEALVGLPFVELERLVARLEPVTASDDRSLESWTRIIFDKNLRTKKAE